MFCRCVNIDLLLMFINVVIRVDLDDDGDDDLIGNNDDFTNAPVLYSPKCLVLVSKYDLVDIFRVALLVITYTTF